jgi:hypothetical protein
LTFVVQGENANNLEDGINSFKSQGLEAEQPETMEKDDYGLAPFVCEGTYFLSRHYVKIMGDGSSSVNQKRIWSCLKNIIQN